MALSVAQRNVLRSFLRPTLLRNFSVSSTSLKDDKSSKSEAAKKLSSLLQSIIKDDSLGKEQIGKKASSTEKIVPKKKKIEKPKDLGKRIVESAEAVAKTLPGKKEETEAQLLHKLLFKDSSLAESIVKAASKKDSLMNILSEMKIVKESHEALEGRKPMRPQTEYTKADHVRDALKKTTGPYRPSPVYSRDGKINLFGEKPLGIFKPESMSYSESVPMETWNALLERDLQLLITHPPANIYEQMIIWTNRGILWKFPIDNEQGLDDEKQVDFTEHVFLETHLEGWCPDKGPIRHFMELVCVGLSRNYYLSAQEKKDHILWYKEFFTGKKELIHELGAGEIKESVQHT